MTLGRLRLVFAALALALALPGALLVRRALASVALEREARDRAVAERAFDEMERALTELLRTEEARAASDYEFASPTSPLREPPAASLALGYFQIEPDGRVSAPPWASAVVPLARRVAAEGARVEARRGRPAAEPALQRALPEGIAGAPLADAAVPPATPENVGEVTAERELAPPRGFAAERDEPRAQAEAIPPAPERKDDAVAEPAAASAKAEAARPLDAYDALAKLNTASKEREERPQRVYLEEQQQELAPEANAAAAAQSEQRSQAAALVSSALASEPSEPGVPTPMPGAERAEEAHGITGAEGAPSADVPAPRAVRERAPEAAPPHEVQTPTLVRRAVEPAREPAQEAAFVRVVVDPLRGRLAPGGELLLVRTAWVGERGVRQGLALDPARLERALAERTFASGALPGAALRVAAREALAAGVPASAGSVHTHRFAEPFDALGARLELAPFADPSARNVAWLAALFAFAGAAGLAAVYRMVSLALDFAQRRSNFAAAVSHELKTPLTAIRMYAEMLRDGLAASDAKRTEYYGAIHSESERLSRLIDNVLEFSRLERGVRVAEPRVGDAGPVAREAVELLRAHARARGLELALEVDGDLPPVRFERDALLQVLFNLIDNAVKYGRGEPARIEIACRRAGDGVALTVRDHGPGVPREEQARILEPFYRRGDELTRSAPGAGIGLALVKGLAAQMGAAFAVTNAEGGGLIATLELSGARAT